MFSDSDWLAEEDLTCIEQIDDTAREAGLADHPDFFAPSSRPLPVQCHVRSSLGF